MAFYLCAKRPKLKVDKIKLIELCGTSESGFSSVSTSMKDLCRDVFGISKETKDPRDVKGNRGMTCFGFFKLTTFKCIFQCSSCDLNC
ncbi:origin of replication complex subunit 6-like [Cornus florida]|uniref:origin of replication complex subunit 6-like n=1 Tax=Cornus florida TaxID=4283 RepID=UPI0028A01832|nr:origin of replication complex subunit 6-like [Cornus florida]